MLNFSNMVTSEPFYYSLTRVGWSPGAMKICIFLPFFCFFGNTEMMWIVETSLVYMIIRCLFNCKAFAVEITATSYEYDSVSDLQQLTCLLNSLFRLRTNQTPKLHITAHNQSLVDSSHKGPLTWKAFPCCYIILEPTLIKWVLISTWTFDQAPLSHNF